MVLPLAVEMELPATSVELWERFRRRRLSFWLDSGMDPGRLGRYSFLGSDPFWTISSRGRQVTVDRGKTVTVVEADPLEQLRDLLQQCRQTGRPGLPPFYGGAVGYLAYDLGRQFETLPGWAVDDLGLPDLFLGFYDAVAAIDHRLNRLWLLSTGLPETDADCALARAQTRLDELREIIAGREPADQADVIPPLPEKHRAGGRPVGPETTLRSNFTPEEYCRAVARVKEYIAAGDIYQVNLSQRFTAELPVPPDQLYRRLRLLNPAPFAACLDCGEVLVLGASPERFLQVRGRRVETRPIKGTRPRGADPAADRALREELWNSEKDRAELLMIIDLERNDLGRVCEIGSVRVPELYTLESYATVHHLVSTVTGLLPPGRDIIDLLRATFPGGSITGAPKIRAMEIIEELEPVRRGIYTGSIGYIGFNGDADLNIAIRTLVVRENRVYLQVGGGIVADSVPEREYQETLDKGKALFAALCGGSLQTAGES